METSPLLFTIQALRMGGRVVDRARLESVFTFIGNEGSNPSPSAFFWSLTADDAVELISRPDFFRNGKSNDGTLVSLGNEDSLFAHTKLRRF